MMTTKTQRLKNDAYYTPTAAKMVQQLTSRIKIEGTVLDPCAGDRTMAQALHDSAYDEESMTVSRTVFSSDLTDLENPAYDWKSRDTPVDATKENFWKRWSSPFENPGVYWTVTNPPFNVAPKILPLALEHSAIGIAMLLRVTYIEPCSNRAKWLEENKDCMVMLQPVNPRPKFRADKKGSDSATVAWFVWDKRHSWKALGVESPFQFAVGWNQC